MELQNDSGNMFLDNLKKEVEHNLTNDQFGVEELAKNIGMSRSQLHRKLNGITGQSVSQFIREYRLQKAMGMLRDGDLTAAEVADRTGFGSATYFNKCFNEFYGFPPGEAKSKTLAINPVAEAIETLGQKVEEREEKVGNASSMPRMLKVILISFLVLGLASIYFYYRNIGLSTDKSIAILPFKNLSEDPKNEYFSEGVIEAIRTSLAQVKELRVISRTSVEQYRNSDKSAKEIASELGVSAFLEGSIQRNDNQIRIDVRLVDGSTQQQVWARTYDRELADVFAIQTEIAREVANELHAKLSPEEKSMLSRSETANPKAYDLYLKGIYEFRTYTNKGIHNAISLFTQAVELDPNYARAYAFLANGYFGLATIFGAELSALDAFRLGKPYLDKALALDPDLDEAQMLMGFYLLYNDWDFKGADEAYKVAITTDHPDALAIYADFLNFTRRHKEALEVAQRLNAKEPYYPNSRIVHAYFYNKRFDEALQFSEARLKMFSNYSTFDAHGFLLLNTGRYNEAITYFNKAINLEGIRFPRMLGWMGAAYAKSGQRQKAIEIVDEFKERLQKKENGSISFFIAVIYSALGEKDQALSWLESAYNAHDMEMPWLMTEPQFYNLHQQPRFIELSKKIGF